MDSYSRMVQLLKVLLPLAAIALLSTVFLLSRSVDTNVSTPFAPQDMDARLRGQQVTGPQFSGTTSKGEEILISADLARPGGGGSPAEAEKLKGRYKLANGREMTLDSDMGSLSPDKGVATFSGNVVITTADGIRLNTELLNTSLNEVRGDTPGRIDGTGPIGDFSAGGMRFGAEKTDGPVHILFTGGVKLLYDPRKPER